MRDLKGAGNDRSVVGGAFCLVDHWPRCGLRFVKDGQFVLVVASLAIGIKAVATFQVIERTCAAGFVARDLERLIGQELWSMVVDALLVPLAVGSTWPWVSSQVCIPVGLLVTECSD
jgi:hypothetical protein